MRMGKQENGKYILSLDFDICEVKNSEGERVGCEYTENKLREFLENIDVEDGLFSSSTQGNYNVLVDYTNSFILRDGPPIRNSVDIIEQPTDIVQVIETGKVTL
jgi:hypothetical protein